MAFPARDERDQLSEHELRLQRVEEIVARTEGAVHDLQADVQGIRADVQGIRADVQGIQADVQRSEKLLLSLCRHVGMEV